MSWKVGEVPLGRDVGGAAVMTLPANYLPLSELKAETAMELGIWEQLIRKLAKFHLLFFSPSLLSGGGLGPLHVEDEVVVAEPVEGGDRLGRVLLPVGRCCPPRRRRPPHAATGARISRQSQRRRPRPRPDVGELEV